MFSSTVRLPLRLSQQTTIFQPRCFSTSTTIRQATEATVTPLPYFVHRSKSKNFPVYEEAKRGGNMLQTRIRKVEGNADALREQLIAQLNLEPDRIFVNYLTRHVIIKGHWKKEVGKFLAEQKF